MAARKRELTTPDLVLLSLLAERPMHGYEANLELERRQVRDWAGISRPQVYYSLEKLRAQGLIRAAESEDRAAGPERSVFVDDREGPHCLSRRAGARGMGDATGASAVSHLDRLVMAGEARDF